MSVLLDIVHAFEEGRKQFELIIANGKNKCFAVEEIYCNSETHYAETIPENRIVCGDNLDYMEYLIKEKKMQGKFQLVYMDPPFFQMVNIRLQLR